MRPISSPNVRNAIVALVGVSAIALGAGSNVRAEDCLAAPKGASPAGQHWYYRIDRVKQRKCWYLHAPQRVARQTRSTAAVANAEIDHPAPAAPMPAAAAPMPFAAPPIPIAAVPMPAADPPVVAPAPATDNTSSQPNVNVQGSTTTLYGIAPQVGYNLALTDSISFWPKVFFAYAGASVSNNGGSQSSGTIGLFAPFLFHVATHFYLGVGPDVSTQAFVNQSLGNMNTPNPTKITTFGAMATVGGWTSLGGG